MKNLQLLFDCLASPPFKVWKNGSLAELNQGLSNKYKSKLLFPGQSVVFTIPRNETSLLAVINPDNQGSFYLLSTLYDFLQIARIFDSAGSSFSLVPDESTYYKFKIANNANVAITCSVISTSVL